MRLEKALVDQGSEDEVIIRGVLMDVDVEVVRRNPENQGKAFIPQPRRWVVEQVNGARAGPKRMATSATTRICATPTSRSSRAEAA